jgi:prophage endopeptidase
MIDPRSYITYGLASMLVMSVVATGVQTVRLSKERATHADTRAQHAQQLQRLADATTRVATAAQQAQQAHQQAVASIDSQHTQELSNALAENDRLRAAGGPGRLRIPAACTGPSAPADLPVAPAAAGVDAQAAESAVDAGQLVWDLRAALITEREQLLALQDYARLCSTGVRP